MDEVCNGRSDYEVVDLTIKIWVSVNECIEGKKNRIYRMYIHNCMHSFE